MHRRSVVTLAAFALVAAAAVLLHTRLADAAQPDAAPNNLTALWTSGDPEVAQKMGLMYTHAAKRNQWFDGVRLIVWGPSQKLVIADKDIREKVLQMIADGVQVQACIACANMYGLTDQLRELGIEVKGMGIEMTDAIKGNGQGLLSF